MPKKLTINQRIMKSHEIYLKQQKAKAEEYKRREKLLAKGKTVFVDPGPVEEITTEKTWQAFCLTDTV